MTNINRVPRRISPRSSKESSVQITLISLFIGNYYFNSVKFHGFLCVFVKFLNINRFLSECIRMNIVASKKSTCCSQCKI